MDLGEGNKEGFLKNIYSYNYSIRLKLFPNGKKEGREEVGGGEKRGGKESGVKGREASKLASIVLRFKKKKNSSLLSQSPLASADEVTSWPTNV